MLLNPHTVVPETSPRSLLSKMKRRPSSSVRLTIYLLPCVGQLHVTHLLYPYSFCLQAPSCIHLSPMHGVTKVIVLSIVWPSRTCPRTAPRFFGPQPRKLSTWAL